MSDPGSLIQFLRHQRRRLTVRHPLTGERLWRIRFRLWFGETFHV